MKRKRSYSRVTRQALSLLGKLIRIGRTERGMTAQDLADRAGISRTTLYNIEKGEPGPEVGIVFEVAALVGVRLFEYDERTLAEQAGLRQGTISIVEAGSNTVKLNTLLAILAALDLELLIDRRRKGSDEEIEDMFTE